MHFTWLYSPPKVPSLYLLNIQLMYYFILRWYIFSVRLTGTHPLFSFPWPGTSDSGSTGSDCAVVYRPDTPCCPCRYSSGPSWLCAWRNPYSLRSCTHHNASLHTQIIISELQRNEFFKTFTVNNIPFVMAY